MDSGFLVNPISVAMAALVVELSHTAIKKAREEPRQWLGMRFCRLAHRQELSERAPRAAKPEQEPAYRSVVKVVVVVCSHERTIGFHSAA